MTRNQIDYLKHLETVRSNKIGEIETHRANLAREFETRRANIATETETRRHNQHSEGLAYTIHLENVRHNVQSEGIQRMNAETAQFTAHESQRSNLAREAETHRSNIAKEQETYRSNVARETETHRANVASESIGWANVSVAQRNAATREAELAESSRHNLFQESELRRSNMVNEDIRSQQVENEKIQLELNKRDAATREKQANIAQQQADLQKKRYMMDWSRAITQDFNSSVNAVANSIDAIIPF